MYNNPDPAGGVGGLSLAYARARAAGIPLVAIGGITYERARSIVSCADAVAAIAELLPAAVTPDAPRSVAQLLQEVTARASPQRSVPAPAHLCGGRSVTLAVDAVVIAGGLFLGRLVARVIRQRRQ